MAGFLLRLGHS